MIALMRFVLLSVFIAARSIMSFFELGFVGLYFGRLGLWVCVCCVSTCVCTFVSSCGCVVMWLRVYARLCVCVSMVCMVCILRIREHRAVNSIW